MLNIFKDKRVEELSQFIEDKKANGVLAKLKREHNAKLDRAVLSTVIESGTLTLKKTVETLEEDNVLKIAFNFYDGMQKTARERGLKGMDKGAFELATLKNANISDEVKMYVGKMLDKKASHFLKDNFYTMKNLVFVDKGEGNRVVVLKKSVYDFTGRLSFEFDIATISSNKDKITSEDITYIADVASGNALILMLEDFINDYKLEDEHGKRLFKSISEIVEYKTNKVLELHDEAKRTKKRIIESFTGVTIN